MLLKLFFSSTLNVCVVSKREVKLWDEKFGYLNKSGPLLIVCLKRVSSNSVFVLLKIEFPGGRDMYRRSIFSKRTINDWKLPVYGRRAREHNSCAFIRDVFMDRRCRRGRLFDLFVFDRSIHREPRKQTKCTYFV